MNLISVKERLPEYEVPVVILTKDRAYSEFNYTTTGFWYHYGGNYWAVSDGSIEFDDVTHWMPLPEPPKEK